MTVFCLIDTLAFECLLPETKGKHLVEHMPGPDERFLRSMGNFLPKAACPTVYPKSPTRLKLSFFA
ncbi:unnamed protein product [Nippostrongylus brasiliensis]|uniref:Uncharacterized protein n=1 Tax=Nippostrongylus brasiliensis TaxID=27835 RepID=A0A0N4YZX2_NIPBR|nr:unnamed protein product [Nippostrongylus brasiliensis]